MTVEKTVEKTVPAPEKTTPVSEKTTPVSEKTTPASTAFGYALGYGFGGLSLIVQAKHARVSCLPYPTPSV